MTQDPTTDAPRGQPRLTPDAFERQVKTTLAPLLGEAVSALKVIHLSADLGPWLDTGLEVQPGDRVSVLLHGRVWISRQYDVSLEAPFNVWRRIGADGPISRGVRETDTFTAGQGGTIQLKNLPWRWLDSCGHCVGEPVAATPDGGGGVSVALVRWAPGRDVAAELDRLAAQAAPPAWVGAELARLATPAPPPAGWRYLWELGPAEIFREVHTDGADGGPPRRIDARTHNDVAILQHESGMALTPQTRLQWAWKVDTLPAEAPEDVAITHDYLSIAVEFDNGQDLTYMWSRALPLEHAFRCPLEGWRHRETHLVVRSGTEELGRWLTESRNVYEDYARAVGGASPERVVRVWLIANSIFGRREGRALFGDIRLGDGARLEQVW